MSQLIIPTYGTGFARNAAESAYPELWRGLVGLWSPALGPTGLTLHDWAGKNPGILTSMDAATDWVTSEKGYVLDYDGSDYVNLAQPVNLQFRATDSFSVSVWANWSSLAAGIDYFFSYAITAGGRGYYLGFSDGAVVSEGIFWDYYPRTGSPSYRRQSSNNNAIQRDTWHNVVITQDQSNSITGMKIWVDANDVSQSTGGDSVDDIDYSDCAANIGARRGGSLWRGSIGDTFAWNRVLTANEIAQMYAGANPLIPRRRRYVRSPVSLVVTLDSISVTQPGVTPSVSQPTLTISVTQSTITISEKNRV